MRKYGIDLSHTTRYVESKSEKVAKTRFNTEKISVCGDLSDNTLAQISYKVRRKVAILQETQIQMKQIELELKELQEAKLDLEIKLTPVVILKPETQKGRKKKKDALDINELLTSGVLETMVKQAIADGTIGELGG